MKNRAADLVYLLAVVSVSLAVASCSGDDGYATSRIGDTDAGADSGTAAIQVVDCASATVALSVSMEKTAHSPADIAVYSGQVIEWANDELTAVDHTVTSKRPGDATTGEYFDSGEIAPGESFCLQFHTTGTFEYFCEVHPTKNDVGVITVE